MRKILYCRGISSLPFNGSTPSFASPLSVSPRSCPVMSTVYISDLIQPAPVHRMEKQFKGRRCSPLGQYLVQARVSVDRGARCFSLDRWRRCWRTRRTRTTRLRTTTRRRRLRLRRRTTRRPLINCVITVTKLWLLASALQSASYRSLSSYWRRDLNCCCPSTQLG